MISIIDYKAGNLTSVERALKHLNMPCRVTGDPAEIMSSDRVVFPGVGAAGKAMEVIKSLGLDKVIHDVVAKKTPFLGICLGAQIILSKSEEDDAACLGVIPGMSKKFPNMGMKIPHMGWNNIEIVRDHPIFEGVDPMAQFYFVHSYYTRPENDENIIAKTNYGIEFASAIGRGNVVAVQFHPEKSGENGLKILKNFSEWNGEF
jgi:glutamine amidotransferase